MAARKPSRPERRPRSAPGESFAIESDMLLGHMVPAAAEQTDISPIRQLEALTFAQRWKGKEGRDGFKLCRSLIHGDGATPQGNEFLAPMYWARVNMANDGFRLVLSEESGERLAKSASWFAAEARTLAQEVMQEFCMMDNAAVFWMKAAARDDGSVAAAVVDTEEISDFTNGEYESLTIIPAKRDIPKEEQKKYEKGLLDAFLKGQKITLDQDKGEYFNVVTMDKRGRGLAHPSMLDCLDILGHLEAVRTGDMTGAWASRYLYNRWTVGHEIKNGERAGRKDNFATPKILAAFQKMLAGKRGFLVELFTRHDVAHMFDYIPNEFFSEQKYEGALMRLRRWGSALAVLMMKDAPDGAVLMARAEIAGIRERVGTLLETIFNRPEYGLPKLKKGERIGVAWSPVTFMAPEVIATNVGQWLGNGIISVQTSREVLGFDNATEVMRLTAEKDADGYRPNFEAKQGMLTAGTEDATPGGKKKGGKASKGGPGAANGGPAAANNGRPAGS